MASTDEERVNRGFAEKNWATFPILSDPDKSVCTEYGVVYPIGLARRWTFYIGPDGIIRGACERAKFAKYQAEGCHFYQSGLQI